MPISEPTPHEIDLTRRPAIGVIHIALEAFGIEPFAAFVHSYRSLPAGAAHDLLVVFKGFGSDEETEPYRTLLKGLPHWTLMTTDQGFDIGTYQRAIAVFPRDFYCMLNSRSVLLAENWLEKMYRIASRNDVGLVSATASFESLFSDHLYLLRHRRPHKETWRTVLRHSWLNVLRHWMLFPPFPNPHLRTNAVMIRREIFNRLRTGRIVTRSDTARFENGRMNITGQIRRMGLRVLVVGRTGQAYEQDSWSTSGTFWNGGQRNLLVADNQTMRYEVADEAGRQALERQAWRSPRRSSIED